MHTTKDAIFAVIAFIATISFGIFGLASLLGIGNTLENAALTLISALITATSAARIQN